MNTTRLITTQSSPRTWLYRPPSATTCARHGRDRAYCEVTATSKTCRAARRPDVPGGIAIRMSGIDWQDVARFGELACGSLDPVAVQRRTLPDLIRLLQADSGAIHLIDHRYKGVVATIKGAPSRMLVDFDSISRRTNLYLQQSFASRFPVHDAMIHCQPIEHQRSPEGLVLSRYGFEHCLFTLLLRNGRPVGTATVARRTGRPPFTPNQLALAHRLGGFLSIALANAASYVRGRPVAQPLPPPSWSDGDIQTLRLDDLWAGKHDPAAVAGPDVTEVLTKREREVLVLAMSGLQNAEIAVELGIATNTVKQHMKHILRKIGVRSRLDALRYLQSERCAL
jgi:DNA-binding CsgD family transcriptional regulator